MKKASDFNCHGNLCFARLGLKWQLKARVTRKISSKNGIANGTIASHKKT